MKFFRSRIGKDQEQHSPDPVWILESSVPTTSQQRRGRESDTSESSLSRNLFGIEWIELTPEHKDQDWKKIDGRFELVKLPFNINLQPKNIDMSYSQNYQGFSVYGNGLRCEEGVYYLKSLKDETVHKLLGSGLESDVYEVEVNSTMNSTRVSNGVKYALKVYKKPVDVEFEIKALKNNSNFQNLLTPLLCFMVTEDVLSPNGPPSRSYLSILYEKFKHDLFDEIVEPKSTLKNDTNLLLQFSRDLFNGVKEIHDMGFLHNDIKPENIGVVVDSYGKKRLKLCDFGLCTRQLSLQNNYDVYDTNRFHSLLSDTDRYEDNHGRGSMAYVPLQENMKEGRLLQLFDRDAFSSICVITVMCTSDFPFKGTVQDFRSIPPLERQISNLKTEINSNPRCPEDIKNLINDQLCFSLIDERMALGLVDQPPKKFRNMSTDRCIELLYPPQSSPRSKKQKTLP